MPMGCYERALLLSAVERAERIGNEYVEVPVYLARALLDADAASVPPPTVSPSVNQFLTPNR
jgi:hypothetical protein